MIWKITLILISILIVLVNLLLWWKFIPRIVDKRIARFQSDLVSKSGEKFLSHKQGTHGFGLLRIDSIVDKYHGYINRQTENGVFATEVMLPLV